LGGEVEKAKLIVLMQSLQVLNLKVDSKGLKKTQNGISRKTQINSITSNCK